MEGMKELSERLLTTWCEGLYRYQIRGTGDERLDGAFLCPSCGKIHGRSADAVYPFMTMFSITSDRKWLEASEALLSWSEKVVSCSDGSYINDIDSKWRGITVFALTSFMDALFHHGDLMPEEFRKRLEERALKAASYLASHDEYKRNNVNYPISIALALYMAGKYFDDDAFILKSREYRDIVPSVMTDSCLLFGEGVPRDRISERGCRSVDIGYNVEESIPALVRLAELSDDKELKETALALCRAHLSFLLPDGGWDNSFGTRVFKWTYWGSRTSDGAAAALLMLSGHGGAFASAAYRNLRLMEECTHDGLLYGGPDLHFAGEPPCIHHTFTHAKIPALILSEHLFPDVDPAEGCSMEGLRYFPEIDTYRIGTKGFLATVTGYDWPYMKGGHASGGTLSLLHGRDLGPMLVSGMAEYSIKEANNQQIPSQRVIHECLSPRIEAVLDGRTVSSLYDTEARISHDGSSIIAEGHFTDGDGNRSSIRYRYDYTFSDDEISIKASMEDGILVLPVVSRQDEEISISGRTASFSRGFDLIAEAGTFKLPHGTRRIFNLVPGLQALRIDIIPDAAGTAMLYIRRRRHDEQDS